jgi:hypothetical protein
MILTLRNMTNDELKKWLRENSSGAYRPAREAANLIERQEQQIALLGDALRIAADRFRHESVQWQDAAEDIERILPNVQDEP